MNHQSSLEEKFAKEFLDVLRVRYQHQYRLGPYVYDFYLPEYNTLVEINGTYWHGDKRKFSELNPLQQKNKIRDMHKAASCPGFKLLTLWELDIEYDPQSVMEFLDAELP